MTTIAVIGANGQVGSEVCLLLSLKKHLRVIPICRTTLGSSFLRRCGLTCRHGTFDDPEEAARLIADCDLVADFSLPRGLPSDVRKATRAVVTNAITQAPQRTRFVYISSVTAFGMSQGSRVFKNCVFAHSLYGSSKRYGEHLAFKVGRRTKKEIYVLRLGQVHGEFQGVSRKLLRELDERTVYVPAGPSYTIFAFTVAEALENIAAGREEPGLYTLVSAPEWTWKEVCQYYVRRRGLRPRIVEQTLGFPEAGWYQRSLSLTKRLVLAPLTRHAVRHAEFIAAHLPFSSSRFELRLQSAFKMRQAEKEIEEFVDGARFRPFDIWRGKILGRRLKTLSDSRTCMERPYREIRALLKRRACKTSSRLTR